MKRIANTLILLLPLYFFSTSSVYSQEFSEKYFRFIENSKEYNWKTESLKLLNYTKQNNSYYTLTVCYNQLPKSSPNETQVRNTLTIISRIY
jgi:hypothetical protein